MVRNSEPGSPFIVGNMIVDPADFFGRTRESKDVFTRLQNMGSTSIVGPRRIGKSSIAYYIYRMGPSVLGDSYEFVWLDGQSNHSTSPKQFFSAVAKKSSLAYNPADDITECLIRFEDSVTAHSKKLVLIINEFEMLTDVSRQEHFDKPFYNTLRLLAEQGHCALITTSYEPLKTLCRHILGVSSPFYNIFEELNLKYFASEEADEFLHSTHHGVALIAEEINFIKGKVKRYQHPLVLQIASDTVYKNRQHKATDKAVLDQIEKRANRYFTHEEVQEERKMTKQKIDGNNHPQQISKSLDLTISIIVPVIGIGLIMLVYGLLIKSLTNFQAILLGLVSTMIGFAILIFAGRSINIIGESTFFKAFMQLINQLPLFSSLADNITRVADKLKND